MTRNASACWRGCHCRVDSVRWNAFTLQEMIHSLQSQLPGKNGHSLVETDIYWYIWSRFFVYIIFRGIRTAYSPAIFWTNGRKLCRFIAKPICSPMSLSLARWKATVSSCLASVIVTLGELSKRALQCWVMDCSVRNRIIACEIVHRLRPCQRTRD